MYGRSPIPNSPTASRIGLAGVSPIPGGFASPRVAGATPLPASRNAPAGWPKNPLDELPGTTPGSPAPANQTANTYSEIAGGSTMLHCDTIIPFNISIAEKLLGAAERQMQSADRVPPVSSVTFSVDQLVALQHEATEYVDGLSSTLKTLFGDDNNRVRKRLGDLADTPLTFQYFRLQQQMMQLSGDYSLQRDKEMLHRLASLLE